MTTGLIQKSYESAKEVKQKKIVREKKPAEKTKLSFKEKKELESLPAVIEEKEKRKHEIFEMMADPAFYQQSGAKAAEIKKELEQLEKELIVLFARWEELEAFGNGC